MLKIRFVFYALLLVGCARVESTLMNQDQDTPVAAPILPVAPVAVQPAPVAAEPKVDNPVKPEKKEARKPNEGESEAKKELAKIDPKKLINAKAWYRPWYDRKTKDETKPLPEAMASVEVIDRSRKYFDVLIEDEELADLFRRFQGRYLNITALLEVLPGVQIEIKKQILVRLNFKPEFAAPKKNEVKLDAVGKLEEVTHPGPLAVMVEALRTDDGLWYLDWSKSPELRAQALAAKGKRMRVYGKPKFVSFKPDKVAQYITVHSLQILE